MAISLNPKTEHKWNAKFKKLMFKINIFTVYVILVEHIHLNILLERISTYTFVMTKLQKIMADI